MMNWRNHPIPAALFLAAGVLVPTGASSQIPEGWVQVGTDSVKLALMGRCWEEEGKRNCVDTWYMFREPDGLDLDLVEVAPGEALRVTFSLPPDEVTIMPYNGRRFEADPDLDPAQFSAPTIPGTHYYAVSADWGQGEGMWMFKVQVDRVRDPGPWGRKERSCPAAVG